MLHKDLGKSAIGSLCGLGFASLAEGAGWLWSPISEWQEAMLKHAARFWHGRMRGNKEATKILDPCKTPVLPSNPYGVTF